MANGLTLPCRQNRLLASMKMSDYALMQPYLEEMCLNRGDVLHFPELQIENVYFIGSGIVSLIVTVNDGHGIETASIGWEGAVGTIAGFCPLQAFTRAVVQVPGIASRISSARLRVIVRESNAIRDLLTRYHMSFMGHVQQLAACNQLHDAVSRLCRLLLLGRDHIGSDTISITHEGVAEMLGLRRTTVTAAAQTLQAARLVRLGRGQIEILDHSGLNEQACECYAAIRRVTDRAISR